MARAGIGSSVEGVNAVRAALAAGRARVIHIERGRRDLGELRELGESAGAEVRLVDDARDLASTDRPQGVVAECHPISTVRIDDLAGPGALLVVLDHLTDPRNVGAIARSALAFGSTGLVISDRRAAPLGAVAFKAAAGALESIPVAMVKSVGDAVDRLKQADVWTVGLDSTGSVDIGDVNVLSEPVAVVVGEEGSGLSRLVAERVDVLASIPMAGSAESLNASVAAAVALYECARARR